MIAESFLFVVTHNGGRYQVTKIDSSKPSKSKRTIVFVTYETEFAPCGGLAAVMRLLPRQLAKVERCCTIAPYFSEITSKKPINAQISKTGIRFKLKFGGSSNLVRILQHRDDSGYMHYLLEADRFFNAPKDPYINPGDPDQLLEDSLFFCSAVPVALRALDMSSDMVLHLQDWESASVAQTAKLDSNFGPHACLLTLHNPYDRGLDKTAARLISASNLPGETILTKMIPLVDGPLSTVSENFARELTNEFLHTDVFADHLQELFREKSIIGVDNGLFGELSFPFSQDALTRAEAGDFSLIRDEKKERRIRLGEVIGNCLDGLEPDQQVWGDGIDLSDPNLPVFFFLGRDDPRQKGYDVAAAAISSIPKGLARYVFTPMPGDEGFEGLRFLKRLAEERPGEVIVFPFRVDFEAFTALQKGSSFMVMCSLYEPFGGATEAYLAGMPVVARATGGLIQQVFPLDKTSLPASCSKIVDKYHGSDSMPTGFLFREPDLASEIDDWQKMVDCAYLDQTPVGDRLDDRRKIGLFNEMSRAAGSALRDAIALYADNQDAYAEMIYHGYKMLSRFSWDRAIKSYRKLYDGICRE